MGRKGAAYITASRGSWAVGPEWEDLLHKLHRGVVQESYTGSLPRRAQVAVRGCPAIPGTPNLILRYLEISHPPSPTQRLFPL